MVQFNMQKCAEVARDLLANAFPESVHVRTKIEDADRLGFVITADSEHLRVVRTAEVMGSLIWDEIFGVFARKSDLPPGASSPRPGLISVGVRGGLFNRVQSLSDWTPGAVRAYCERLNHVTSQVLQLDPRG